jgi:hypothetical protein
MSDTKRELIIQACLIRTASITTANGFNTDMGLNTFRAISKIDPSRLPACIVYPFSETAERVGGGEYLCTMPLRAESVALTGIINPSVLAEQMLGDMRQAFMGASITPIVEEIAYTSGGTNEYTKNDSVSVTANFTIKYFSKINDPYA